MRGVGGPGRGGGPYSVPPCVPVTRAVTAQGPSVDLTGHGGCSVRTGAWPRSWGGTKGFLGVRNQGTEDRPPRGPSASLQPGSFLVPTRPTFSLVEGGDPLSWWAFRHALP